MSRLCPSYLCRPGARLIGIVLDEGGVAYMNPPPIVDAEFVEAAAEGRAPEDRFRFAGVCVESGCAHWQQDHCGLVATLTEGSSRGPDQATDSAIGARDAPRDCGVEDRCRWRAERGEAACQVCARIVRGARHSGSPRE